MEAELCARCATDRIEAWDSVPAGFEGSISRVLQLPLVWRIIWRVDFGLENYPGICGKPSALCTVGGVGSGTVAPDPLPPCPTPTLPPLRLHSRVSLPACDSKTPTKQKLS